MFESSRIEVSRSAYRHNLRFIRKRMKKGVRLCSVVKGNAYGHGILPFVEMAMDMGVDCFGVHSADEAYVLRNGLEGRPDIFVMGAMEDGAVEWAIREGVEFSVFDHERLDAALDAAREAGIPARIHIEMETGMRRTGFDHTHIPQLCQTLTDNEKHLIFQGLFTHYAGAESLANDFRVSNQMEKFNLSLQMFAEHGLRPVFVHSACSAGLLNYPETQGDMVRIGILQYGFWPNRETHVRFCGEKEATPDLLKRVIRWVTRVMAVKEVRKGCFIGYGTSYLAHRDMRVAVIPIGYAHGYSRNLSNVGAVLIGGKNAPIVGTINMNSLTVDVSNIKGVKKGDEVVLIGRQNGKAITVSSFSEQSHQLNYEMLTRLPVGIPRTVVD